MCGIAGYVNHSSADNSDVLDDMVGQIVHRGPDSSGKFISKNKKVALGIRRLSIIDLTSGDQPISNETGDITVVYNGEIYNYRHLRKRLEKKGHRFKTKSDTEVLVHLYEEYGKEMLEYLNGMFAFALWDEMKQKLFLARDRSGIKPLYYFQKGNLFVFGSEVKTIIKHPLYKKEIDQSSLSLYGYFGFFPGEKTIFKGINKLLPGHSLIFKKSKLQINKYFNLAVDKDVEKHSLDELMKESVRLQLQADVPVGVFLSGGLDSSLITYYISKLAKLKSFSISFDVPGYDESEYAREVAKKFGTKHYSDTFKPSDVVSIFHKVAEKMDEPFADAAFLPTYKLSKLARQHVKVALSGDGADELFGGYPTYQAHLFSKYLSIFPKEVIEYIRLLLEVMPESLINLIPTSFKDYSKKELASILLKGVKKDIFSRHMFLMRTFFLGSNPLFGEPKLGRISKLVPNLAKFEYAKRAQVIDYHTYLPDDFFFKVDRASMYNSLEVRVPYMDNDIIDFAFSTSKKHIDMFKTKKVFRRLVSEKIPEIARRPKRGFGVPLGKWFNEELKDFAKENLNNMKLYELAGKDEIEKVWKEYENGKESNAGTIWMLIVLSGWLENWM